MEPGALQRLDRDEVRHVDAERLVLEAELAQLVGDLRGRAGRGCPVSTGIAPRIGETPARKFSAGSQGANSWWWRAAEPKSHRIGSAPRASSVKRAFLSRAHSPMCVLVT